MDKSYQLTVNNTHIYDRKASEKTNIDVVEVSLSKFHILKNNEAYTAEIVSADFLAKRYTVKVNGNSYQVSIANSLDLQIKEMGFLVGGSKQVNEIKAPMPGLILEISVSVGQEVQENDCLLILEAMKMENSFLSPRAGIIKSISAKKGDAVDKGQLLIEFE
jgi:biotin carboxyl carrier protein